MQVEYIAFALAFGILPALLWLWFWTREDRLHPEPKRLLLLTFIAGGATVALTIPVQQLIRDVLNEGITSRMIMAWATAEEVLKYLMALAVVLWRRAVDEPIDNMIYMITVALGFAAVENTLFLLTSLTNDTFANSIIVGNFRFFGSTLLHVLSSSVVGVALAWSFYKSHIGKITYAILGVILASVVHSAFNLFILKSEGSGIMLTFSSVWVGVVILLLFFEKFKLAQIVLKNGNE